jgi:hypothetical protein
MRTSRLADLDISIARPAYMEPRRDAALCRRGGRAVPYSRTRLRRARRHHHAVRHAFGDELELADGERRLGGGTAGVCVSAMLEFSRMDILFVSGARASGRRVKPGDDSLGVRRPQECSGVIARLDRAIKYAVCYRARSIQCRWKFWLPSARGPSSPERSGPASAIRREQTHQSGFRHCRSTLSAVPRPACRGQSGRW